MSTEHRKPFEAYSASQRRLEDKIDAVANTVDGHTIQLTRIEDAFHSHIKRQVVLEVDLKQALDDLFTGIDAAIIREIGNLKSKKE